MNDQHIAFKNKNLCSSNEESFCTHLPIVSIDTNNQEIPGEKREGKFITTNIKIINNKKGGNHLSDKAELNNLANIRYRGHSSVHFDKKSYLIKFINKNGEEDKEEVIGMPKHDEWVLYGPFVDKTLIRNYLWYNISSKIMESAPNSKFCELFVDDEYMGLYLMVESPSRGDSSRMKITKNRHNTNYTSYILRLDRGSNDGLSNLNTFSMYTYFIPTQVELIYPGKNTITDELKEYITNDFSKFEKALFSYDFKSNLYGYPTYINIDSFVDYYLINEFTQNYDATTYSTYIYKDLKGKYNMYVWDFNNSCDNYIEQPIDRKVFGLNEGAWYFMLMKDKSFTDKVINRYRYLRKNYFSYEYLNKYIDETIDYLGPAIQRNFEKWNYSFEDENDLLIGEERHIHSYEEAVNQLKTFIKDRGDFLDKHIDAINLFSHESKIKKFLH